VTPFSKTWKRPFVYGWEDEAQKRLVVSDTEGGGGEDLVTV